MEPERLVNENYFDYLNARLEMCTQSAFHFDFCQQGPVNSLMVAFGLDFKPAMDIYNEWQELRYDKRDQ